MLCLKNAGQKVFLQLVCFIWSDFYANISQGDANGQYWLGAIRDTDDPKNWKWIDGKTVTVSFWNLPGGNENCARFDGTKGWLWSDTNCGLKLNFICQHRMFTYFFLSLYHCFVFQSITISLRQTKEVHESNDRWRYSIERGLIYFSW